MPIHNKELDERVRVLRMEEKLSFRQIAKALQKDVRDVYRRYKRVINTMGEGGVDRKS